MLKPLRPKTFHGADLNDVEMVCDTQFLQWDNLTHLVVEGLRIKLFLHIMKYAVNI